MTDSMSDDAQAARAKRAQQNLANLRATGIYIASDLSDAMQPADQEPVARAHITGTPVTAAEPFIDRRMEVLDETRLQPKDSPVDLYTAPMRESSIEDMQTIYDLRQRLATTDARIVALEAEILRLRAELQDLSSGLHP